MSSSFATTSSYNLNSISSSYATFAVSSTSATSANTATSASYATNAGSSTSATTANSATSASYSLSSSYSVNSTTSTSSSFASTASYNLNSISSSFAATSSYNLNSISSSYSLTASFALNGGGGGTTLTTGSSYPITSSWAINAITASYALNASGGGSGGSTQTGSIANQTILYNVTTSQDNVISGLNLSSNKWGVTVVEEWNTGSGDIYYSSSSLLMHFSGSNGSTTFTDSGPNNFTITPTGDVKITSSISKFGGTSGFFDGTGDSLTVPSAANAAFNPNNGFTVEGWVFFTSNPNFQFIVSSVQGVGSFESYWFVGTTSGGNWRVSYGGASPVDTGVAIVFNTWTHFALSCTSTNARLFVNGIQIGAATVTQQNANMNIIIGEYGGGYNLYYFNGYLDELRFTKGVARYTASFVTQSVEFPNQLPQYATKYIGLVGGLNDSTVDYGVEKLSDSSLKIRKMTASGQPLSGSGTLSASVDRVYVNVLDYTNVMVTSSYALTASYVLGGIQTGSISNQTILYNVTTSQDNTITGLDLSGNKWDVSVIEEWNSASVAGDLNYSSCSLLMHFSGSDGSTTFTDNSPTPKSFTRGGNAQVSTVQSKFGGSSLYLDGSGDYITTTYNSAAFDWWTTDYTIECFIYPNNSSSLATGTVPLLIGNMDPGGSGANYWSFGPNNSKQLSFYYFNGAGIYVTSTETVTVGQWNHIAATKNSTGIRLFINGTASVSSASVSGTPGSSVSYPLTIGQYYNASINAYVDEVRITKGVARYTASFTVPDSAFPDTQGTTPQYATKYIGLVGGINDSNVDYGVEKLSDTSLKIRKMSASGQPLSGSGALSASVDRVYVNVLNYKEVQTTAQSASYAVSSSYLINASAGESFHPFLLG